MDINDLRAIALVHTGMMTLSEAADIYGVPVSTLHRWCKKAGFDPNEQRRWRLRKITKSAEEYDWKLPARYVANIEAKPRKKTERVEVNGARLNKIDRTRRRFKGRRASRSEDTS